MRTLAVLASVLVMALGQQQPTDPCSQRECPPYTLNAQESVPGLYEVREYNSVKWVATTGPARRASFWRLFRYIQGNNDQGVKMDMTVPVLFASRVMPGGPPEKTMMFYIPAQFSASPPQPSNPDVFIENFVNRSFYVKVFNTMEKATPQEYQQAVDDLKADIGNPSLYDNDVTYTAGFHSPWYQGMRHNEVWLAKL